MADYQTNRASFVQKEWRVKEVIAQDVYDRNPKTARVVSFNTQLDEATATSIANKYLSDNVRPRSFEVTLEGLMYLDKFIGGSPSFIPNFAEYATSNQTMKVMGYSTDFDAGRTIVRIRG